MLIFDWERKNWPFRHDPRSAINGSPADVVIAGGGADGEGIKALEEVQPGRSHGRTTGQMCRWLEYADKITVRMNMLREILNFFCIPSVVKFSVGKDQVTVKLRKKWQLDRWAETMSWYLRWQ